MGHVRLEVSDGIARIILDNPARANSITPPMARQMRAACDAVDEDASVGAAVIAGAQGTFCSGGDRDILRDVARDPAGPAAFEDMSQVYDVFHRVGRLAVPTVAAVRGAAVGAGVNLLLMADLRVMAANARIRAGFQQLGIHPGGGHFALLGKVAGWDTCAALGLFGVQLSGAEAASAGLAWRSVPDEEVEPLAEQLARVPAADPELARHAVRSFRAELGPPRMPFTAASDMERSYQMWSMRRSMR